MKSVFIAIEGFNLKQGYLVKELSIVYCDNTYQHYQFKTPENFTPSAADEKIIHYAESYLNGFSIEDDFYLSNDLHTTILKEFVNFKIYVAGDITKTFIANILPDTRIIDTYSLIDFRYPTELPNPHCFKMHRALYCSLAKAIYIKSSIDTFFFQRRCCSILINS